MRKQPIKSRAKPAKAAKAAAPATAAALMPRQKQALDFVKKNGEVSVSQLNAHFGTFSSRLHVFQEACAKLGVKYASRRDGHAVVWFIASQPKPKRKGAAR